MSPAEKLTPEVVGQEPPSKTSLPTKIADRPHHWTMVLSAVAIVVSVTAAAFSIRQSNIANEATAATIYDRTTAAIFELDKIDIAYPELRPYFYENRELRKDDPLAPRAYAVAEMTLDAFEIILTQIRQNPARYPTYASDRRWMIDSFKKVLRDYFDLHKTWYAGEIVDFRRQAAP